MLNINNQSKKKKFRPHFEAIHLKFTNIFVSVTDDKYRVSHSSDSGEDFSKRGPICVPEKPYIFPTSPVFLNWYCTPSMVH